MATKIYTKTGDAGHTSLLGGAKVSKSHSRIEAYGTVDELNAHIGLVNDHLAQHMLSNTVLHHVQNKLFIAGSLLAVEPGKDFRFSLPQLHEDDVLLLEQEIDKINMHLPELKNFILPGGHIAVSAIHVARCVCRRAERICVRVEEEKNPEVQNLVIKYLNRLSDYLFVLARFAALHLGVQEVLWQAR